MEASTRIREALAQVSALREMVLHNPELSRALSEVKAIQANRFAETYRDMLMSPVYSGCATFFLEELYSERDYRHRDAQFAKVAVAVQHTFPVQVVEIAVTLAELHHVTEALDLEMAQSWIDLNHLPTPAARYRACWRKVGQQPKREWQLNTVLGIGSELSVLTRKVGLRWLLKMMRKPADLAGLGNLQSFLETGFDHFGSLAKDPDAVKTFLVAIQKRESEWINGLFEDRSDI